MLTMPMDVLYQFPVRKTKAQKQAFRDAVQSYAQSLGYASAVETGSAGCHNLVIGDPEQAKYLITAHYDTCAQMPFSNRIIPDNPLMYVLYHTGIGFAMMVLPLLIAAVGAVAAVIIYILGHHFIDAVEMGGLGILVFLGLFLIFYAVFYLMTYIGPANPSNANDNTSGVVTVLEIARSLPENQRHKVCFVLFDLNEVGLIGSSAYRKKHDQATNRQIILNLSCVGDGDDILLIPNKKLKQDIPKLSPFYKCCGYFGNKSVLVLDKGASLYPCDHSKFPYGLGISAFHKGKTGHHINRIHTAEDTILDQTNVNILRAAIVSMISCGAAQ